MRSRLTPIQDVGPDQAVTDTVARNGARPNLKEIPYDYVATFTLTGTAGNRVQDVINTSVDGAFIAVAIGYSFIPNGLPALPDLSPPVEPNGSNEPPDENDPDDDNDPDDENAPEDSGNSGIQVNGNTEPSAAHSIINWLIADILNPVMGSPQTLKLLQCLMVQHCGIHFKYSIIDSAVGRELQNIPIHNIAGLGEVNGNRPFRPMAKPMLFMPRSTIRIEIEEISQGPLYEGAELYIVLHGYKILGYGTG